ncbi:MAG TPA: hydrogen gas-evolving membrane-bound hydrogenase subunit E [Bacteroidales bacterium]|nr:hydrogen gas-evolving membrane-bound hydrogenase subunit E [Bacteroidales bacterium]
MELAISVIVGFMILGALYAIHARDLLSAVIAGGIVGYSLVICFLLLKAPDLAIVQIVVETITLIIMVAVVLDSSREEAFNRLDNQGIVTAITGILILVVLFYFLKISASSLDQFGEGTLRMSKAYIEGAAGKTGSANLVTGVVFDFRGYDTLGEATVLVTAVLGVLTVLRIKGKK